MKIDSVMQKEKEKNTEVISFRLPETKVKQLQALLEQLKPVGVYSPNQLARFAVDSWLQQVEKQNRA